MKIFTPSKGILSFVLFFLLTAFAATAQSVTISPSSAQTIAAGSSISFSRNNTTGFPNNGTRVYDWVVTKTGGIQPGDISYINSSSSSTNPADIQFNAQGTYQVVLNYTRGATGPIASAATTVTVTAPPPPAISISPVSTAAAVVGGTANFNASTSNFSAGGTITYSWTVTPGTAGVDYILPSGNSNTKTVTFLAAGDYSVSVTATKSAETAVSSVTTVTAFIPNLYSTSGTGTIKAYKVNPVIGSINYGPVDLITPSSSTAGIGKNKANVNDPEGSLYYILNTNNNSGQVQIYSISPIGANNTLVGTIDLNGSDNTALGFVRLGFDANGKGWIIAGDGSANIYIASFQGNGSNAISNINTYNNTPLGFSGGGSAADFQNGDLAIGANGVLYALANVTGADTYIYTLNSLANPTTLTRKWTVQTGGAPFAGTSVNGVAWTQTGSLHVSTGTGLYFIDQTTANSANGTVQSFLISSTSGLTDLASSEFPSNSTLPIAYGEISVKKTGNNAELTWTTLTEVNNDYFLIERSEDGINFKSAGTVKGKGNTSAKQTYSYLDPLNTTAKVVYYRLRQVDEDGKTNFSNTVSLRLNGMKLNNYAVYPNPFVSDIKLQVETDKQTDMTVRISNASGQVVMIKSTNLQKGENIIVVSNLSTLKPGMYIVELISADWKQTLRVAKQ